jgi:radical SAM protein with 4Fe4S-binding SPASM domain
MLLDHCATLPAGRFGLRLQVVPPAEAPAGTVLCLDVIPEGRPGAPYAEAQWPVDAGLAAKADDLGLIFALNRDAAVQIRVWISNRFSETLVRAVTVFEVGADGQPLWPVAEQQIWPMPMIRNVVIGNSGVCTASCLGCPTNKAWLDVPTPRVMSDAIFERVVAGLAKSQLRIEHCISFGLFGDPLVDRKLAQRIRYLRERLPAVAITANTNAAAYAPRQDEAIDLLDAIGVHIESLVPEVYDRLMAPLKLSVVKPRIEALVARAGKKAVLAVPVHQDNQGELRDLRQWWENLGGGGIAMLPFSNRSVLDPAVKRLHLSMTAGTCNADLALDLIIDWDGKIHNCCTDFGKLSNHGSLETMELTDILSGSIRADFHRKLRDRAWQKIENCATCRFDSPGHTNRLIALSA